MALNKTSKVVLGACTCAVLIYPSGFIVRFLAGAAVNSVVVKLLKRLFNEQRPEQALREGMLCLLSALSCCMVYDTFRMKAWTCLGIYQFLESYFESLLKF